MAEQTLFEGNLDGCERYVRSIKESTFQQFFDFAAWDPVFGKAKTSLSSLRAAAEIKETNEAGLKALSRIYRDVDEFQQTPSIRSTRLGDLLRVGAEEIAAQTKDVCLRSVEQLRQDLSFGRAAALLERQPEALRPDFDIQGLKREKIELDMVKAYLDRRRHDPATRRPLRTDEVESVIERLPIGDAQRELEARFEKEKERRINANTAQSRSVGVVAAVSILACVVWLVVFYSKYLPFGEMPDWGRSSEFGNYSALESSKLVYMMATAGSEDDSSGERDRICSFLKDRVAENPPTRGDRSGARRWNEQGLDSVESGDWRDAVLEFENARSADSGDVEIVNNLGFALLKVGRYADAETVLVLALTMDPERTNAWANLGESLSARGEFELAVGAYVNAHYFSPNPDVTLRYIRRRAESQELGSEGAELALRQLYGNE